MDDNEAKLKSALQKISDTINAGTTGTFKQFPDDIIRQTADGDYGVELGISDYFKDAPEDVLVDIISNMMICSLGYKSDYSDETKDWVLNGAKSMRNVYIKRNGLYEDPSLTVLAKHFIERVGKDSSITVFRCKGNNAKVSVMFRIIAIPENGNNIQNLAHAMRSYDEVMGVMSSRKKVE